jgi:CRP-like cAMP-binding protein
MAAGKKPIDKKLLKSLKPIGSLSPDVVDELAVKSTIEELPAGRLVFRQGERDKRVIYLLSGQLELSMTGNPNSELVKARTVAAKYPVADTLPRPSTARTRTPCRLLYIDRDLLEILSQEENSGLIEVSELADDDDSAWMLRFLQSRAFLKLPTENIQTLLMKLEEVPVRKDQIIIRQGDVNDYYYIVQKGRCAVLRRPVPKSEEVQLAILDSGDGFGEEALITGGKRNATIKMLEAGVLMRLGKKDFMKDLAKPLINEIDQKSCQEKIAAGSLLIDVRSHDEFMQQRVEGSVNIPLTMLRLKIDGLNNEREYVLVCDDGSHSSAAAFLLTQHGLDCYVLKGGLNKNNLTVPDANFGVEVDKPTENRKTVAARKNQQAAEAKAEKIKQEAITAKREAEQIARKAADLEAAKRQAETEIQRLQKEEASKREAALKAAKQRLKEESQRAKKAEEDAARLKLEAKAVKRKAEEELNRLRNESETNSKRQAELDQALQDARNVAEEAARQAQLARQQAEREAREIRRRARQEAERLRAEMEEARMRLELEAKQLKQQHARQHQAALEAARQQAESEAEKIREAAIREAEKLRSEVEAAREEVEAKAAEMAAREQQQQTRILEETRRQAEELARLKTIEAEREAERIRREAVEEAERLRNEIQSTRELLADEVAKARAEAEKIAAEKKRQQDEAEAHLAEQQLAEAETRKQAAAEKIAAHQTRQRESAAKKKNAEKMRRKAEQIKARLEQAEKTRQEEEARHKAAGMSLSHAVMRRSGNRIILEGEQDMFIFKEPALTPEDVEEEPTAGEELLEVDELPSFEVPDTDEVSYVPIGRNELSETFTRRLNEEADIKRQRRNRHLAIAATVLFTLGAGIMLYAFQPQDKTPPLAANNKIETRTTAKISKPKLPAFTDTERHSQEQRVKQDAVKRHNTLLQEWKRKLSVLQSKVLPSTSAGPGTEASAVATETAPGLGKETEASTSVQ